MSTTFKKSISIISIIILVVIAVALLGLVRGRATFDENKLTTTKDAIDEQAQKNADHHDHRELAVGDTTITVHISDTPALQARGLSDFKRLGPREGMLFVFPEPGLYSFWMKDMNFAIDMLWLDSTGRVIHLEEQVSPETYPNSFVSSTPASYVLEVPAGFSEEQGITIGSLIAI